MGNFPHIQIQYNYADAESVYSSFLSGTDVLSSLTSATTYTFECSASSVSAFATEAETISYRDVVEIPDLNLLLSEQRETANLSASFLSAGIEETVAPALPVLSSPADGSINVSPLNLQLSWTTTDTNINALSGTSFDIQISTLMNFTDIVFERSFIADTSVEITSADNIEYGEEYYWRVRGSKIQGGKSGWSGSNIFTTQANIVTDIILPADYYQAYLDSKKDDIGYVTT